MAIPENHVYALNLRIREGIRNIAYKEQWKEILGDKSLD